MTTRSYDLNLNRLTRIGGAGRIRVEGTMSAYSSVTVQMASEEPKKAVIRSNPAGGYRYEAEVEVQQGNNFITVTASLLDPVTGQPPVGAPQVVTQQYQYQASGISRNFSSTFSRITEDKNGSYVILRKFDYDAKNRLKKVTVSGTVTEWDYDWADRRVREWQYPAGGSKPAWPAKLYIWDGTELVQERVCTSTSNYNSGGTVSRTHYFGGFNDGATLSGTKYQTTTDHLGNVRDVINASGTLVARYDYTPWGKPTKVSGTTVNASLLINSRYYHHAASGLHLALYRAYDPDLGRWLSEDPIEEEGGINMYGFVGNNPLMAVDPLGLFLLGPGWGMLLSPKPPQYIPRHLIEEMTARNDVKTHEVCRVGGFGFWRSGETHGLSRNFAVMLGAGSKCGNGSFVLVKPAVMRLVITTGTSIFME